MTCERKVKRNVIVFSLVLPLLLFCSFVYAQIGGLSADFDIVVDNTKPNVTVLYNESIRPVSFSFSLEDDDGTNFDSLFSTPEYMDNNKVVNMHIEEHLWPGFYVFTVSACDMLGNCDEGTQKEFEIELSELNITLVMPRFMIFSSVYTDLIIETNRPTRCRYGLENSSFDDMRDLFILDEIYSEKHEVIDFEYYYDDQVFVACIDSYGTEKTKSYIFTFDDGVPLIEVSGDDIYSLPLSTSIEVKSKNKPVQCRFTKISNEDFDEMRDFTGLDLDDEY